MTHFLNSLNHTLNYNIELTKQGNLAKSCLISMIDSLPVDSKLRIFITKNYKLKITMLNKIISDSKLKKLV